MNAVLRKYINDVGDRVKGGLSELGYREGQMVILDHIGNLQVLYGNVVIVCSVRLGRLIVKIPPLPGDLEMRLRRAPRSFTASMRPLFAST